MDDFDRNGETGDLVYEMYGAALNPERYEDLVNAWEHALAGNALFEAPSEVADAARIHAAQVTRMFGSETAYPVVDRLFAVYDHLPAILVDPNGAVLRANERATRISGSDQSSFAPLAENRATLLRQIPVELADGTPCEFLIIFDRSAVAGVARQIAETFDLTGAEQEVLSLLLQARTRKEIAARRDVSPETVKKQTERILAKTGTLSQLELTLVSASMYRDPPATGTVHPVRMRYFEDERQIRVGNRIVSYRVFGAQQGRPLIFFHGTYGFCRWPAAAEAEAARRGWRVIVPIRPGYGNSDPGPEDRGAVATILDDMTDILDAEDAGPAPLVSVENDSALAFTFAASHPDRATRIIAFAGMLPATREAQYRRMDKWHRFVVGTARYTPSLIPVVVQGGFRYAARIGREGFVRAVYGDSPPDVALLEDGEIRSAILDGTRVALSPRHLAHRAYALELRAFARGEWATHVAACEGKLPVHLVNGATDPIAPPETVEEFRQDYPWIEFELHEEAGQFIFFQHWKRLFELLEG